MRTYMKAAAAAVMLLVVLFPLASQGQRETEEVTTVRFLNFSAAGGNEPHLEAVRDAFEADHPDIRVSLETIGYDDYFTQLQTRIAGGQAPDAFELNFENFAAYANRGQLKDLTGMLDSAAVNLDDLNPQAMEAFSLNNRQYGLPASFSTVVMFYNKELFDQAGVSYPADDWSWDEAHEAAAAVRDLGDRIFGLFQPIHFHEFFKVVQQYGGGLLNESGSEFTVDRSENIKALEVMVSRIQDTNVMPSSRQLSGMGDWDLFISGRLGMLVTGIWAFPAFTEDADFDWDIVVEPKAEQRATHFFANGLSIHRDSRTADAAFAWLSYLSASETAGQIRLDAGWELPASSHEGIVGAYASRTPPENREAVFTSLDYLVTPPVITEFSRMQDIITMHLQAAADGSVSPAEALRRAQQELEAQITL